MRLIGWLEARPLALAAATVAAAVALRLLGLGRNGLWSDEAFTALVAGMPWAQLGGADVFNPPGHVALLKLLLPDAGAAPEWALRLPSVVAGSIAAGFGAWAVATLRLRGAGLAGWLGAACGIAVWYGQEARNPALAGALLAAAAAAGLWALRGTTIQGAAGWALAGLCAGLAMLTHYTAIPLAAAVFAVGSLARWNSRWQPGIGAMVSLALFSTELEPLARAVASIEAQPYALQLAPVVLAGVLGVAGAGRWLAWLWRREPSRAAAIAAVLAAVFVGLLAGAAAINGGYNVKRHLAVALPLALPLAAVGLARLGGRWQAAAALAMLPGLALSVGVFEKEQWREVAAAVRADLRPGDSVQVHRDYLAPALRYYLADVPVAGVPNPGNPPRGSARVWLAEAHGAAALGPEWQVAQDRQFYRVRLRLLVPAAVP